MKNLPKSRYRRTAIIVTAAVLLLILALTALDQRLLVRRYTVETDELAVPVRLALITDLHSCDYGENQSDLIDAIAAQNPDVLLLGGDIFDDVIDDTNTEQFLSGIAGRYPCYYVTGNHEYWSGGTRFAQQMELLVQYGVTVMENDTRTVTVRGQTLLLGGIDDPEAYCVQADPDDHNAYIAARSAADGVFSAHLDALSETASGAGFSVLLSHRPEYFDRYAETDFDLVLCGHAHGGQWRIPFLLNGVYAPHQGMLPRYAGGRYDENGTTMIVSRGLARETTWVPRIFNRPELVIIDIVPKSNS